MVSPDFTSLAKENKSTIPFSIPSNLLLGEYDEFV